MSPLQLTNLAAYCIQIGVLVAVAGGAASLLRPRRPQMMLAYWRFLLLVCLLLPLLQPWRTQTAAFSQQAVGGAAASGARFVESPLAGALAAAAATILLGGIVLRFAWLAIGFWRLRRFTQAAIPPAPPLENLALLQARMKTSARFLVSDAVTGPVTCGWRSPAILLPARFLDMDARQQEAIACHELLHVKRRDWLRHLLEEAVRCLFWFHPAIWWLLEMIQLTREQVVDEQVVARTRQRGAYLDALLEMACPRAAPLLPAAAAFVRQAHLRARVSAITGEVPMSRFQSRLSTVSLAFALAAGVFGAVWSCSLYSQQDEIYSVRDDGVAAPRLIVKVEPGYTEEARAAKVQGTAIMGIEVWPDGQAHNLHVKRSLDPGLDVRAIEAIQQWRFKPGEKDGRPVKVKATIEVNFRLL